MFSVNQGDEENVAKNIQNLQVYTKLNNCKEKLEICSIFFLQKQFPLMNLIQGVKFGVEGDIVRIEVEHSSTHRLPKPKVNNSGCIISMKVK